jgi:predicted AlkP superfamily phosphohydrolase/phosphomutase
MTGRPKVLVIGLDCAEPSLVFDRYINVLPNLKRLISTGVYARMRSSDPPITVPAWAVMMTGKDPGQLGFYGFRNRNSFDYDDIHIVDSSSLKEPCVWDILGKHGYQSIVMGVPPSYPPKPIQGHLISCFLTPEKPETYTYPASLAREIEEHVGEYQFDVKNFRTSGRETLLEQIYQMTETRFNTARYLMKNKPWDFMIMVEMGVDRIHHAFWQYMDDRHVLYQESPYQNAILDYYRFVDQKIGEILDAAPAETRIFVVSDHGAKRMDGGFCINEWLIREGYLTLRHPVDKPTDLSADIVDWKKTIAWGYGGYYGRLCLNVKGREPQGVISPGKVPSVRKEIIQKLKNLTDEKGNPLHTKVIRPDKRYLATKNIPPDLLIYFGDLYWRSVGKIGLGKVYIYENDTGPDGANHDYEGIFITARNREETVSGGKQLETIRIVDLAPTLLAQFGIQPPKGMQGKMVPL